MSSRARGTAQMTVGALSRRIGVPVKALREYEDAGLNAHSCGRSPGNYRLFDEEALWCVEVIRGLRAVGLTLAEIRELAGAYLQCRDELIGPRLAALLDASRARTEARIAELRDLLARIDAFEAQQRRRTERPRGLPRPRPPHRQVAGLTLPPRGGLSVGADQIPEPERLGGACDGRNDTARLARHGALPVGTPDRPVGQHRPRRPRRRVGGLGPRRCTRPPRRQRRQAGHTLWWNVLLGLGIIPAVATVALRMRGQGAAPLRVGSGGALCATAALVAVAQVIPVAILLFIGITMLIQAGRGADGCELLEIPNVLLRRHDRLFGLPLTPIDELEARRHQARHSRNRTS